jgi:hypothetical protein
VKDSGRIVLEFSSSLNYLRDAATEVSLDAGYRRTFPHVSYDRDSQLQRTKEREG